MFCGARTNQQQRVYPGHGDIGAGAVVPAGGKYVLTGIYALGDPEQASRGDVIGFMNVFTFIEWIELIIDDEDTRQSNKLYNKKNESNKVKKI